MKTSDFDYELPQEYIAQTPLEPRDASRLLILRRDTEEIEHTHFRDLGGYLRPNDLLVINQTRVIPARIFGRKIPTGGRVELLLLRRREAQIWEALAGGKGLIPGKKVQIEGGPQAEILSDLGGPRRLVRFEQPLSSQLDNIGHMPLPPYIQAHLDDPERYQTVYAQDPGSAAAPTAGLHFTPMLIEELKMMGVNFATVTLHVGLDTFAPVNEDDPHDHEIHTEWCHVSSETVQAIKAARHAGGRVIAVGTTSVRTLESAARYASPEKSIETFEGPTNLFILPGYSFKIVDAMITNFHLPRSTLLMLVSAFAERERILLVYETAKRENYRFYSFGDAMLIV
ncbi:MAG: tRNA preQ1(34) S-adenosylmethionine ribosyltransferase-isomerase QueA [Anaerolineales bacterium]|nr:tRNA preQ1(34) S-adenosylmethionine ribosyltransferase-isomerase QueA [Chloroflexota bacterium]MBL6981980.1 tRNA preQ1(34) S-adenosylmethionine ribosyltransferase-isomerase QueA [Anaerolineales bacterium]